MTESTQPTSGTTTVTGTVATTVSGIVSTVGASQYPAGATPLAISSGNLANGVATATLTSAVGKTAYLSGFEVTGAGATVALPVTVTVVGLLGGTASYTYGAVGGVLLMNAPLVVTYDPAVPASGTNVPVVVSCPALGLGNTNSTVV